MSRIYLTTTLPYVNSDPHIGFALEIVQADVIARYLRLIGNEVYLNTGTDEHGVKIYRKAEENGVSVQDYVDKIATRFRELMGALNIDTREDGFNFIRTTDEHHVKAAQEFWKRCLASGDIYKKNYKVKYCVGCELEKTESELEGGKCPIHPTFEIESIEEENYFFRFSKYGDALLHIYDNTPDFVLPASRLNEIRNFVKNGLEDFSISRLASKMPWGIAVPDDADHVMYVWFDALVNYVSAVGWPDDMAKFEKLWPVIQLAGKDNLRQQSAMWQAMLLSAGIEPSKQILIHGFINSGGQKMSKSLGNVVDPVALVNEYGADALRYWLAREMTPFEDGDFTLEKFKSSYNAELANGIGNLTSRVLKMAESYGAWPAGELKEPAQLVQDDFYAEFRELMSRYELNRAADFIWTQIKEADLYIQNTKPFSVYKTDPEEAKKQVAYLVEALWRISVALVPFMPSTAEKIQTAIKNRQMPEPLFLRKE